ncbi:MAG: hypothetical protein O8C62_09015 [Candidatus Methanoperedens sp.]|nr:hypothetical protein [Candidatus Methanoperedens sp.]
MREQKAKVKAITRRSVRIDKTAGLIRRKPRDSEKVKIFCEIAAEAVKEGIIFKGKRIVEVLPWED